jgi:hypothetical protein
VLLTRSPLYTLPEGSFNRTTCISLSAPPAFVLSQDQTLHGNFTPPPKGRGISKVLPTAGNGNTTPTTAQGFMRSLGIRTPSVVKDRGAPQGAQNITQSGGAVKRNVAVKWLLPVANLTTASSGIKPYGLARCPRVSVGCAGDSRHASLTLNSASRPRAWTGS